MRTIIRILSLLIMVVAVFGLYIGTDFDRPPPGVKRGTEQAVPEDVRGETFDGRIPRTRVSNVKRRFTDVS